MRAAKILQQTITRFLASVHATRLAAVFWAVRSLLIGGKLYLTALGRSGAGRTAPKYAIKRIDRLLGNGKLHQQTSVFYKTLAKLLIGGRPRPVVLIDWTKIEPNHVALVAAVPLDGRSLPILIEVHPEKKDNNPKVLKRFLRRLADILPPRCRPIIVTDAGFKNTWFTEVVVRNWDFVGRVRHNALARDLIDTTWVRVRTLYQVATKRAKDLGRWVLAQGNPRALRLVVVKKHTLRADSKLEGSARTKKAIRRAWEPWLLATSLDDVTAKRIVDIYASRMQIEETFRDAKNHRFGWSFGLARSGSAKRLEVLLLIAALGMFAVTLVGHAAENRGLHRRYQANTVRDRRVLSLFYLGCAVLRRPDDLVLSASKLRESLGELQGKLLCLDPGITTFFVGIP